MLGRRDPQRGLFDVIGLPHTVDPDSFYGRMGAVNSVLFKDDDLAGMYTLDNGRPSLPPSLMCGVTLLRFYDDVSDGEAVERLKFDLRWKVALALPLDYPGFDPSSLSVFRKRLVEHGKERYAFDRFIEVGREAGLIPPKVTLLVDTVAAKGAGAVQDTYTLLGKGIRRLLKAMGYELPGKRQGLGGRAKELVASYLDRDRKAAIDWSDPAQRAEQLKVLVRDAQSALEMALEQVDEEGVREAGWLLTKILGDDTELDEQGNVQIAQGTAPDRIVSVTDPEMRHGRKSASRRFDGFKVSVATEADSELIMDMADMPASEGDGKELLPTVERVEEHAHVRVGRVIGDGAYPSGENLAGCADHPGHPVELVSPLEHGLRATRYTGKEKRGLQRLWTGAAVNLKRLFKLAEQRGIELLGALRALGGSQALAKAA